MRLYRVSETGGIEPCIYVGSYMDDYVYITVLGLELHRVSIRAIKDNPSAHPHYKDELEAIRNAIDAVERQVRYLNHRLVELKKEE